MQLDFDKWEGNRNKGGTIEVKADNVDTIISRLQMLDQKEYTQIVLGSDESNVSIGGGKGHYICTFTLGDNEQYYNLLNEDRQDDENEIDVVTGGQAGSFPQRIINDFESVLSAVTYYLTNRKMNPNLIWEED